MIKKLLYFTVFILTLTGCKHDPLKIESRTVNEINLIEVAHHYLNESIDVWKLDDKQTPNLLHDLENAHPVRKKRIFTCHEVSITYKNENKERFITDGRFLERISDKTQYELDIDQNLITKYWGISEKEFCVKKGFKD